MYYFYFDSGTTNTRAYLIHDKQITQKADLAVGSRNCSLNHSNQILKDSLLKLYHQLLEQEGIQDCDIASVFISGMVSSPSGLIEIEHLSTPVDLSKLKTHLVKYSMEEFGDREIFIIPGIKTLPQGQKASIETIALANNMRGEEIEIFGILHRHPELGKGHSCIVLPGSHTQVAFLTDGKIVDISSNVTGELYHSIVNHTIFGSSVCSQEKDSILPDMVCMGYRMLRQYGFNRALYIVRTMELFSDSTLTQRRSYLEGVINGGIIDVIVQMIQDPSTTIAVAGPYQQYQIYSSIIKQYFPEFCIVEIPVIKNFPYTVEGLLNFIEIKD